MADIPTVCECRRLSGPIEGNGHLYACSDNPRNMPELTPTGLAAVENLMRREEALRGT